MSNKEIDRYNLMSGKKKETEIYSLGSPELISLIEEAWKKHPQMRLTQFICYACNVGKWEPKDIFYCPDETLLFGLRKIINES
jgi:uncharacterized protein YihD (DUF1040 family)